MRLHSTSQSAGKLTTRLRWAVLTALGVTALGMAGLSTASATPVSMWQFTSSGQFDITQTTFRPGDAPTTNTPTKIAWGTPYPPENPTGTQSSLVINPSAGSGSVTTYTGTGMFGSGFITDPGIKLTHNNFSVTAANGHQLTHAQLDTSINLTSPSYGGNPIKLNLGIDFDETPNDSGSCVVPATGGNIPCPDIFVISKTSLNHHFFFADPDDPSINREYFLSLFPASGGAVDQLSNAACSAAGASAGCFGFITQEDKSNDMMFGMSISTVPFSTSVPEPGVLGMFGFGLLALGAGVVAKRRMEGRREA